MLNNQEDANKEFTEECDKVLGAVSDFLYVIGGKWKLMIIIALARGNTRFTELQRQVKGISARVLSNELKDLELNGFVVKKVSVGYPVLIEYELLPYSHTLEEVVTAMTKWGIQHKEKIKRDMAV
ncbi:DNA-binding transcriptional regulator, HxlR family [Flexibacter flexilis DSM 6793]|uniref:DNA-binding transcriptional regulator, HxlR family n=1 Tax=Flexibacter flexilis DSM 6793 TaxID=927664 RepID=A0A1I1EF35_9BACT|nr:helix-turn-helix domain-containing protein [Flexibacter flexilis]SFB83543.1 DNA-binding transcriptional regulator, HxlR family [Flexibacter flexilis DSM 6793]